MDECHAFDAQEELLFGCEFDPLHHLVMPHCYVCGRALACQKVRSRRRVAVGEWTRRVYGKGGGVAVVQKHGMRIVCTACARRIDERVRSEKLRKTVWFFVLLSVALAAVFMAMLSV